MKIVFLQDDFPPESLGGAGMVAFNLAKAVASVGHRVFVISTVQDKNKANEIELDGLKIYRIYSNYHERWRGYLGLYNPQTVRIVEKILNYIKPDVIHAHNVHFHLSYQVLKIAKNNSRAVFLTAHDVMSFHYGKLIEFINPADLSIPQYFNYKVSVADQLKRFKKRYNPFRNILIKKYLKNTDKIFAVSEALKEAWRQNGINGLDVIYNGIDADDWCVRENVVDEFLKKHGFVNEKIVFFGGKLNSPKGAEEIVGAMKKVVQKIPNAVLAVAGRENDFTEKISREVKDSGVVLKILGWLNREDMKAAYWASNLVVVPSVCFDSFPTVNLEAMACRKPVVGTCFGGTREIVEDGKTGFIVNPFNTEAMAEKIIDLLKSKEKAEAFGEAGYQKVKNVFSVKQQTDKILNYYNQYLIKKNERHSNKMHNPQD